MEDESTNQIREHNMRMETRANKCDTISDKCEAKQRN